MNLIEQEWRKLEEKLTEMGIGGEQRRIMAQSFYGGAWTAADVLRKGLNAAETPDQFAGLLGHVMEELNVIRTNGIPPVEDKSGPVIFRPE